MELHVKELLGKRRGFLELVAVAALLALGVNLLSTYLQSFGFIRHYLGRVSIVLIVGGLSWVLILTLGGRSVDRVYKAAFLFDSKEKRLVTVTDYEFSEELGNAITAVFAENKGLEKAWVEEPLIDQRPPPLRHEGNVEGDVSPPNHKAQPRITAGVGRC